MADLTTLISEKKVKDTVAEAAKVQEKALEEVKKLAGEKGQLLSGINSVVANAKNVISQSISGIVGNIKDSVSKFASTVNSGLSSTLTDLTKKKGSMIGDLQGKVNSGAVEDKLSFLVNTTDNKIDGNSLFGAGGMDGLVKGFDTSKLTKMLSSTGIPSISTNADLSSAMSSVSGSLSSLTSGAKSIMGDVISMPKSLTNQVSNLVNGSTNSLISSITSGVQDVAKKIGLGDTDSLVSDLFDIYKMGKDTYNLVTGKDGTALLGITSRFNNSFGEVEDLLRTASDICSALHGKYRAENYMQNKDLMDLLMRRMANQGMYGALNDLANCDETAGYVDDRTYRLLAQQLSTTARRGDVYTTSTIQRLVGNGRIRNDDTLLYDLARNMDDDEDSIEEYLALLDRMGVDRRSVTGRTYTNRDGSSMYVYDTRRVSGLSGSSPHLATALLGGSTVSGLSGGLSRLFGL